MNARAAGALIQGWYCPIPSASLRAKRLTSGKYQLTVIGLEKHCPRCRDYWPADTEFWFGSKTSDGLFSWCRACYCEFRWPERYGLPAVSPIAGQTGAACDPDRIFLEEKRPAGEVVSLCEVVEEREAIQTFAEVAVEGAVAYLRQPQCSSALIRSHHTGGEVSRGLVRRVGVGLDEEEGALHIGSLRSGGQGFAPGSVAQHVGLRNEYGPPN